MFRTRLLDVLVVLYFTEVGLVLLLAPWMPLWERNYFVEALPLLEPLHASHALRGAVSGVGLVSVAAGLTEWFLFVRDWLRRRAARREYGALPGGVSHQPSAAGAVPRSRFS